VTREEILAWGIAVGFMYGVAVALVLDHWPLF